MLSRPDAEAIQALEAPNALASAARTQDEEPQPMEDVAEEPVLSPGDSQRMRRVPGRSYDMRLFRSFYEGI